MHATFKVRERFQRNEAKCIKAIGSHGSQAFSHRRGQHVPSALKTYASALLRQEAADLSVHNNVLAPETPKWSGRKESRANEDNKSEISLEDFFFFITNRHFLETIADLI